MTPRRLLLVVALVALAVVGVAGADGPQLDGSAGPGYSIRLTDASGAAVKSLDPGAFTLVVDDKSEEHNFRLFGPGGVNVATEVSFVGKQSFSVTLVDGTYNFVCDVHGGVMKGKLTVGAVQPPVVAVPTTRLTLTVTAKAVTLTTPAGKMVKALKAGPVAITVRDRSGARGVRLSAPGLTRSTGVPFVGTKIWTGKVTAGVLVFGSDARKPVLRGGRIPIS